MAELQITLRAGKFDRLLKCKIRHRGAEGISGRQRRDIAPHQHHHDRQQATREKKSFHSQTSVCIWNRDLTDESTPELKTIATASDRPEALMDSVTEGDIVISEFIDN